MNGPELVTSSTRQEGAGAALLRANAVALPLGDETVDCIVTSPPYFSLRSYQDGGEHYAGQIGSEDTPTAFLEALWAVTTECWRVLKPTGSLFVNLGDKYAGSGAPGTTSGLNGGPSQLQGRSQRVADAPKVQGGRAQKRSYTQASDGIRAKSLMGLPWRYAIGCIDGQADPDGTGWVLREELIWSKPNGMPESVKDRCRRSHEQWFHLTKCGTYYADMDEVKVPAATADPANPSYRKNKSNARRKGIEAPPGQSRPSFATAARAATAAEVLPPTVWRVSTEPFTVPAWLDVDHFAAFPTEWPRRLISAWCPPGGVVLDPFGGTGTTAMVARALGRYGVSVDLSADYQRLAHWRIWQSGQAAKVAARSVHTPSLFGAPA